MKIGRVLLFLMLMASFALTSPGQYATKTSKAGTTEKQEEATIPGISIERKSEKGYLGLELEDYKYKLTFYGEDKKPQKADFPRALFRWSRVNRSGTERYMLSVGSDESVLTSPRNVKPPFNFRLFIVLLDDDPETESETYVIHFRP